MSHIIPCFAHATRDEKFVALCGALVSGWEHAKNGDPTCEACARIDAEEADAILSLRQAPQASFGGPVVRHQPFEPTAGYVRRGERRTR